MLHKTLDAKTTTTDLGEFTAIAAAYSVDRDGDRIMPGAFADTIERWKSSGKFIPLHWNHSAAAEDIIGTVDPSSMRETKDGLVVSGHLDLENSEKAREAWRAMKTGAMSLSFGYMVEETAQGSDGIQELKALDLFEITVTPTPSNADTRFLNLKSAGDPISESEYRGAQAGILKAVWTASYVNDLPDSSFLYVESGDKDSEGKTTPRTLRHFPYKDSSGAVDLPHLRNALARIPQSNLPQDVKDRLTRKAQQILDNAKSVEDGNDKEPEGQVTPQDPLISDIRRIVNETVRS